MSVLIDKLIKFEDIFFVGHSGVDLVVKLTQAAVSYPEKQSAVLESLLNAFHIEHDTKHCAPVFLSLVTHDIFFKNSENV